MNWQLALPETPDAATFTLKSTLDLTRLSQIFANFNHAFGVTIALLDRSGQILASSKWQPVCANFHRQMPDSLRNCINSDTELAHSAVSQRKDAIYLCHNGLIDCVAPIKANGVHLGNLFIGQFFQTPPDLAYFRLQAQKYQFDEEAYITAINQVPVIAAEKIQPILTLVSAIAELLAEISYNRQQSSSLIERVAQQVHQRTQQLEMQNQILSMISQGTPLKHVLRQLVTQIEQQHQGLLCSILLLDHQSGRLRHGAAPSLPDNFNNAVDGIIPTPFTGSCGAAAYTGQTVIAEDLYSHPNWLAYRALVDLAQVRSCWSIPIKDAMGKVLGTFGIYQRHPATPDQRFTEKMQTFSNLAELAISRFLSAERIRHMAFFDNLTGLANRHLLEDRMQHALALSKRHRHHGALLFLDLNNFKPVNDQYGHKVGDALLNAFACRLKNQVRQTDTVARLGGDEFIILLTELSADRTEAIRQTECFAIKIMQQIALPFTLEHTIEQDYQCSCAVGMALFMGGEDLPEEILRRADKAMYAAKKQTDNPLCWYTAD